MQKTKSKFINRFRLIFSIEIFVFVFCVVCGILNILKIMWYIQIVIYLGILLLALICLILPILQFVSFTQDYIELRDYKYFFRLKKIVIPIENIKIVVLNYIYRSCAYVYYDNDEKKCRLNIDIDLVVLTNFAKYMSNVKYKVETKNALFGIPQSHREVLAKLNIINKEPF